MQLRGYLRVLSQRRRRLGCISCLAFDQPDGVCHSGRAYENQSPAWSGRLPFMNKSCGCMRWNDSLTLPPLWIIFHGGASESCLEQIVRQVEPNAISRGTVPEAGHDVRGCLRAVLSRIITDAGLSQTQAAKLCATDQPTLSKLLSGRNDSVSADQMLRWMVVLGCQIEINVHPRQQSPGTIKATLHE